MAEKYIKICPKCGSNNITFDSMSLGEYSISNGEMNNYCKNCGYGQYVYDAMFPEIKKSEIKKFKKKLK